MSKRIMSVVVAALLVVSMTVSVFAASNSGSNAASQASQAPAVETTPNGQPITDAYVAALAAMMHDENGGLVASINKNTLIAFSKYIKLLLGKNWAIVGGASENGAGGKRTLKGPQYVAGLTYTVMAQVAVNGTVEVKPVQAPVGNDGVMRFTLPKGTISYAVVSNAIAP